MEKSIDSVLGKTVGYSNTYNPDILVRVPRKENRDKYNLDEANLPFEGMDTWHAYEFSVLAPNGAPLTGLLKIVYPADSKFIVESKSLKLYLNSMNSMRMEAETTAWCIMEAEKIVARDLMKLLECAVVTKVFDRYATPQHIALIDFEYLEDWVELNECICNVDDGEDVSLLKAVEGSKPQKFMTDILRSNCRVTHQPDWGTLCISMTPGESNLMLDEDSLFKYVSSFRGENHFHEEVVEMIYARLLEKYKPSELMVTAIYTRRGGIDICPGRATSLDLLLPVLHDVDSLSSKLLRQ